MLLQSDSKLNNDCFSRLKINMFNVSLKLQYCCTINSNTTKVLLDEKIDKDTFLHEPLALQY